MRIKRFAGVPLLGAVEKNRRTLAPLATTEPQTALQRRLFQLNPASSSAIDWWGEGSSGARHSCQGTAAAANTLSGSSCVSECRMVLPLSSRWNKWNEGLRGWCLQTSGGCELNCHLRAAAFLHCVSVEPHSHFFGIFLAI